MGRLPDSGSGLSERQREIVADIATRRGRVPTPFKVWIHSPDLAALLLPLGAFLSDGISLDRREAEIAILVLARHWGADYVFAVHAREARDAGLDDAVIAAIGAGAAPPPMATREQAVYDLVSAFPAGAPDDAAFARAVAALEHRGLAELLALTGYFTAVALAMKVYAVPTPN